MCRLGKAKVLSFFVPGFANSPKSGRSSGEERGRRFISIVFAELAKSAFEIAVRVGRKKNTLVECC